MCHHCYLRVVSERRNRVYSCRSEPFRGGRGGDSRGWRGGPPGRGGGAGGYQRNHGGYGGGPNRQQGGYNRPHQSAKVNHFLFPLRLFVRRSRATKLELWTVTLTRERTFVWYESFLTFGTNRLDSMPKGRKAEFVRHGSSPTKSGVVRLGFVGQLPASPKEYPRPEKPSISSVREMRGWNYPKNCKIVFILPWAEGTFLWYFFVCMCYFLHERARTANEDIQTHPHLPHCTPFQPQSPVL